MAARSLGIIADGNINGANATVDSITVWFHSHSETRVTASN